MSAIGVVGPVSSGGGTPLFQHLMDQMNNPSTPESEARKRVAGHRTSGFMPDKADFDAALQSQIEQIFSRLPVSVEQFNAEAASRGVFSSGEAVTSLYRDVYQPFSQQAIGAAAQSNLAYAGQFQQGQQYAAGLEFNYESMFTNAELARERMEMELEAADNAFWGNVFSTVGAAAGGFIAGGPMGAAAGVAATTG